MQIPFRRCVREVDVRAGGEIGLDLLSVSIHRGVTRRLPLGEADPGLDDLSNYKRCWPGDVVLNRMRAFQGALGIAQQEGLVSPDYAVLRPAPMIDPRYLTYLMKSELFIGQMIQRLRGIGSPSVGTVRTPRVNIEDLGDIVQSVPSLDEQRRIAAFLDDQVCRIDGVVSAREQQIVALGAFLNRKCFDSIRGVDSHGPRRPSGIPWLGDVPSSWHVTRAGAAFSILLGKMLDESKFIGDQAVPYLRNTNVQWDFVDTSDLKVMDIAPWERERFTVRAGDLLICEGGQPGRCAVWDGSIAVIGFQKALHRARPKNANDVRWLQNVLRTAVALDVFGAPSGQTTIGHLTGEQLRELRIPLPEPTEQESRCDSLASILDLTRVAQEACSRSMETLVEYKSSLITAAVTEWLDATTAGSGVPA